MSAKRFILTSVIGLLWIVPATGQVVQLPTFNQFGYRGTVVVPDGGSAHLGSVRRGYMNHQQSAWGPFGNRSYSSGRSYSGLSAHVHVIDLAQRDREILGASPEEFLRREKAAEAAAAEAQAVEDAGRKHEPLAGNRSTNQAAERAIDDDARTQRGKAWVRDARRWYQLGDDARADACYRLAMRLLPPELEKLAATEHQRFLDVTSKRRAEVHESPAAIIPTWEHGR